jgi:DNA-binding transcriptional LysR family regulator
VAGLGVPQGIRCETIFSDVFACVVSANHPLSVRKISLAQYLKYRHVVVAVIGGQQTLVDRPLSDLSTRREVGLRLPFFSPAIAAVANTDMILTVPRRLALAHTKSGAVQWLAAPPDSRIRLRHDVAPAARRGSCSPLASRTSAQPGAADDEAPVLAAK